MFKKLSAVVLSCITAIVLLTSVFIGTANAATLDEMTAAAISSIMSHEGSYGSVNPNDCGACSVGKLQWHAIRARNLLRSVCNNAPETAQSILGYAFYEEIVTTTSDWSWRTFSSWEANVVSTLLSTDAGIAAQDALAYSDVQGYIIAGQDKGLKDVGALVMYADIYNFGCGVASRIANRAASYAGSFAAVTLDDMYNAAMNDAYGSDPVFVQRTKSVYQQFVNAGYGSSEEYTPEETTPAVDTSDFVDTYAGQYLVTASLLNMRSGPDTSFGSVTQMRYGTQLTVTSANGAWAAVTYESYTGYCSMDYLTLLVQEEPSVTEPEESTTEENLTESVDAEVSTGEITTDVVEETTEETTTEVIVTETEPVTEATTETTTEVTTTEETTTAEETTTTETTTTTEETTTVVETTTTTEATTETVTTESETVETLPVGVVATLYGDVDGDGEVSTMDAVLLQKYITGLVYLSHEQMMNADCVNDGILDEVDVAVIMQLLIGRYEALPIF